VHYKGDDIVIDASTLKVSGQPDQPLAADPSTPAGRSSRPARTAARSRSRSAATTTAARSVRCRRFQVHINGDGFNMVGTEDNEQNIHTALVE
jgi:hypothetical protein